VDFFLWPPLKNSIYQKPVHDLRLKLIRSEKVNEINNDPGRAHLCLEQHGEHFHHLLQLLNKIIVIYYTSGLNECLTSDAFNSASGKAASALTSQFIKTTVYPILH
jgi:hypothetical protein